MIDWSKTISPGYDRIDMHTSRHDDWMHIEMRVGNDVERVRMTIRSEEAIRDLHYSLGRYLTLLDEAKKEKLK